MQKNSLIHYLHLHFLVFIAGFTAILGELITNSSESIVWHRMAIASILAFFVLILRKNTLIISFSKLKKFKFSFFSNKYFDFLLLYVLLYFMCSTIYQINIYLL